MKKISLFSILLFLFLANSLQAQDHYFTTDDTEFIQLRSELTGREHELLVVLPPSYGQAPERLYPTLYLNDAQWDMALVVAIVGKLNYDRALPEIILVGMTYPGADADYGDLRGRDLTPSRVDWFNAKSGDAAKYLRFIEATIIPRIESDFRADPDNRALGGNSLGGLFALYAMYEKPDLFKRVISISPSAVWDDGFIYRRDNAFADENGALSVRLFLSFGGGEYSKYRDPIKGFQQKLAARSYKGLELLNWEVQGERHGGVAAEGWTRGLRWVFQDITPEVPGPLETYFRSVGNEPKIVE